MNGYNFTDGVRIVLANAREESARLHHEYVGTEHMLLGLLRRNDGVAIEALRELGADVEQMRTTIEQTIRQGRSSSTTGRDLPYTSRAKVVLELAMAAARELDHSYVGSEHLLLGMLREQKGVAAQVLTEAGVTEATAREAVLKLLGTGNQSSGALRAYAVPPSNPSLVSVIVEMRYDGGWRQRREFTTAVEAMMYLAKVG